MHLIIPGLIATIFFGLGVFIAMILLRGVCSLERIELFLIEEEKEGRRASDKRVDFHFEGDE